MSEELFVADIFKSIQGEGKKIGKPSLFLRLGICNLHCDWCDTPYTWKKGFTDYRKQTSTSILKRLSSLQKNTAINNLVITGGEPLLQQIQLTALLSSAYFQKTEIELETNGSIPLLPAFKNLLKKRKISFNISPKLADSGNKTYVPNLYPNSILKFVYVSKKSENLIDAFLQKYKKHIKRMPVYIMPEGLTANTMEKKYPDILSYCLKKGFYFTPRWHILLFGNKRAT